MRKSPQPAKQRVYLDLTHVGRHVTGLERIAIEQFEKVDFCGASVIPIRAKGPLSMVLRQQFLLPLLAAIHPRAQFIFPGFPPSPLFALWRRRVIMYVHDTFLITRKKDLSAKARLYMAPQFALAMRCLNRFMVNSEKTCAEVRAVCSPQARVSLYRPAVANVFSLTGDGRAAKPARPAPLRLVSLGTIEPRKNYAGSLAILDELRARGFADAQLHIAGRRGWGEDAERIAAHPGVAVHGYLPAAGVKALMEEADVYLCTSHDEGLGLPLIEAQYAGLPAVAPDAPVFREVLGASGTFIDPARPGQAAEAICTLMEREGWRRTEADKARANIERWNAAAAADLAAARLMFTEDANACAAPAAMASPTR